MKREIVPNFVRGERSNSPYIGLWGCAYIPANHCCHLLSLKLSATSRFFTRKITPSRIIAKQQRWLVKSCLALASAMRKTKRLRRRLGEVSIGTHEKTSDKATCMALKLNHERCRRTWTSNSVDSSRWKGWFSHFLVLLCLTFCNRYFLFFSYRFTWGNLCDECFCMRVRVSTVTFFILSSYDQLYDCCEDWVHCTFFNDRSDQW